MADPRTEINPETGRPMGEDRVDPLDRTVDDDDSSELDEVTDIGGPEPETGVTDVARPASTGVFTVVDINQPNAKEAMREALFGKK